MLELDGGRWWQRVPADSTVSFGRVGEDVDVEVADDPRIHRRCGTIHVTPSGWELSNVGRWLRLRVVGLDRPGFDQLRPGERLWVPWRVARVELHVGDAVHAFEAHHVGMPIASADQVSAFVGDADRADVPDATVTPVRVDRSSGYFRALVALCESQLRDPASGIVATDLEIARRLNRSGRESRRLSGKTVERRLDTARGRFGLKATNDGVGGAGLERRDARRALVDVALLTATVTVADLALLDPEPVGG